MMLTYRKTSALKDFLSHIWLRDSVDDHKLEMEKQKTYPLPFSLSHGWSLSATADPSQLLLIPLSQCRSIPSPADPSHPLLIHPIHCWSIPSTAVPSLQLRIVFIWIKSLFLKKAVYTPPAASSHNCYIQLTEKDQMTNRPTNQLKGLYSSVLEVRIVYCQISCTMRISESLAHYVQSSKTNPNLSSNLIKDKTVLYV